MRRLVLGVLLALVWVSGVQADVVYLPMVRIPAPILAPILDAPVAYQTFQRDAAGYADIPISGTYNPVLTPDRVEARWRGGSWFVIDPAPVAGAFSGMLPSQSGGQGPLELRFSPDTGGHSTVEYVGVGDVFIIAGQSNASGRGINKQSYTHPSLKATLFGNDYQWHDLTDPSDWAVGQVDMVSFDGPSAQGSCWPLLATLIMERTGFPVSFVPCARGGSIVWDWRPRTDHLDRATYYGSMNYRIGTVGGVRCVLWWQGESDVAAGTTEAEYLARMTLVADGLATDRETFLIPCKLQDLSGIGRDNSAVNVAIGSAWATLPNVLEGPDFSDIIPLVDGLHFKTDEELEMAATRWAAAIEVAFGW